jgi:CBS domain-containing protein
MINLSVESTRRLVLDAATAAELMTPNPVSIAADATVKEAAAFLTDNGFTAAPVIDDAGRPIGVVSETDIAIHSRDDVPSAAGYPACHKRPELGPPRVVWTDVVDGIPTPVRRIMTPTVFSVTPETPAARVIEEMLAKHIHRLFVVGSDGVLVGVISTTDLVRRLRPDWLSANGR